MTPPTGSCQPPVAGEQRRRPPAAPTIPCAYGWTGGGASSSGCMTRHVSSTPSWRVKRRAVADASRRAAAPRRASAPRRPRSANSMSRVICSGAALVGALAPRGAAGRRSTGSSLTTSWSGSGRRRRDRDEAEPRRALEDEPQLGLGDRQALAGADEERHARPAPVVDLQPQRGVGLGRRVRRRRRRCRGSRRTGRARSAPGRPSASAGTRATLRVLERRRRRRRPAAPSPPRRRPA